MIDKVPYQLEPTATATDAATSPTSQHTSRRPMMPLSSLNPRDVAAIDLGRILSRLEQKILSADTADPRLQHSSYERTRTSAVILPLPYPPFLALGMRS